MTITRYCFRKGSHICGPSGTEQHISAQQENLSNIMMTDFQERYGMQSQVMQNLNNLLTPIAEAGPDQQGWGPQERAAVNTQIGEGVGTNYAKATQSLNTVLGARGGGNEVLPTGSSAALQATLASAAANQQSSEQLAATEANYGQGRKNWQEATQGLDALASQYNPQSFGSGAQSGYSSAFGMADKIAQEKSQEEASIAGGVASLALDAATFGAGGRKYGCRFWYRRLFLRRNTGFR